MAHAHVCAPPPTHRVNKYLKKLSQGGKTCTLKLQYTIEKGKDTNKKKIPYVHLFKDLFFEDLQTLQMICRFTVTATYKDVENLNLKFIWYFKGL